MKTVSVEQLEHEIEVLYDENDDLEYKVQELKDELESIKDEQWRKEMQEICKIH